MYRHRVVVFGGLLSFLPFYLPILTRIVLSRRCRKICPHYQIRRRDVPLQVRSYNRRFVSLLCPELGANCFLDVYKCTSQVDGTTYSVCIFPHEKKHTTLAHPRFSKLEILDTAGADQFCALPEKYIKVRSCFISSHVTLTRLLVEHSPVRARIHPCLQVCRFAIPTCRVADQDPVSLKKLVYGRSKPYGS